MLSEDFAPEVLSRWPYMSRKTDEERESIRNDLVNFAYNKSSNELQRLFDEFRTMKPPSGFGMWWFYQQTKESAGDKPIFWYRCENGHNYQYRGSSCPVCGSKKGGIVKNQDNSAMPTDTVMIQDSCSECDWYHDDQVKPVFGLYGPSCNEYGTDKHGTIKDYCVRCKCRECCRMEYLSRTNKVEFEKMVGKYLDERYSKLKSKFATVAGSIGKDWGEN
jgi:hypothetical protein